VEDLSTDSGSYRNRGEWVDHSHSGLVNSFDSCEHGSELSYPKQEIP
jgi:hypothetical protein